MPPVEHGPGGDASQSTVSPFLVFMAEVGGQFARGVVVGGVVILLGQIFFRLIKTWYRRRQYSAYDAIPDYDPHPDCDLTYDDADDSSYIPQPLPPDPSTSTTPTPSLTKIKTGEPPVVRHCRLAVRAMLHLVEISPEVIPQAQLFTYRGLRAGGHQRQASVPAFSNPTTAIPVHKDAVLGDKEKQRDEPSAVRPKDESVTPPRSSLADESISMSSGGTRRKSSKKPKTERTSLGRASGARAAVEILEKSIDEGKITAALPSSKNSSPHRHASDIFDNSSSRQEVSFEESRSHETQSGVTDDILAPIKDFKKDDAHNKAPRRTKLAKSFSDFSIGQATNRASFHADTDDAISEENVSRHSVSSTTSTPSARLRKPQSAMPLGRRSTSSAVEDGHRNSPASPTPVRSSIPATYFAADHAHEWTIPGFGRIRFTDHAPLPFKALRTLFGYSFDELNESLARAFSVEMTAGKSESVFFETHNNRYLLKTLRGAEMENLRSFLPAYISYILDNPGTLLPRYLGLYTFERLTTVNGPASYSSGAGPNGRSFGASGKHLHQQYQSSQIDDALGTRFTVVLMAHVFDTDLEIAAKFDFKGSNVGRQALPDDLSALRLPHNRNPFSSHSSTSTAASGSDTTTSGSSRGNRSISFSNLPSEITLKEVDYQRLIAIGGARRLIMGERAKLAVLAQLRSDVALLRKWEFMDYRSVFWDKG
ncbi:uncharacterized protein EV422DRAFT_118822 [Fimicolochytrium jonesii]|uniref:uncharacterized protein n=1 Tax=Fimicolochytrium jonesii TaxID=1396493 RepID=UPI0022FF2577|nr:uncharacterized protein EV422DRAFT_118822 [Fimicolochytrium jonesii]KAI8819130.1 hypothetical protein EV422DRAFT_118822 [Fimicolochytrium jonesii]